MTDRIDLNADLGEGIADDAALMTVVTSCNIACGGHAGDRHSMGEALKLARAENVAAGAHPAYPDREGFGRRQVDMTSAELADTLTRQVSDLLDLAEAVSVPVAHVKPHGALYHRAEADIALAGILAECIARIDPRLRLIGPPESALKRAAEETGLRFVSEGFADRAYRHDGRLVPRTQPGAILDCPEASATQAVSIVRDRRATTIDDTLVDLQVETLCLHGDTPGAVARAGAIRTALNAAGITLAVPE